MTTFVDTQPRVRGALERYLGREDADLLIGFANGILQASRAPLQPWSSISSVGG